MSLLKGKSKDVILDLIPSINSIENDTIATIVNLCAYNDILNIIKDIDIVSDKVDFILERLSISTNDTNIKDYNKLVIFLFEKYKDIQYLPTTKLFNNFIDYKRTNVYNYMIDVELVDFSDSDVYGYNKRRYPNIQTIILLGSIELFKKVFEKYPIIKEIYEADSILFSSTFIYEIGLFNYILTEINISGNKVLLQSLIQFSETNNILNYLIQNEYFKKFNMKDIDMLYLTAVVKQSEHNLKILISTKKKPSNIEELLGVSIEMDARNITTLLQPLK